MATSRMIEEACRPDAPPVMASFYGATQATLGVSPDGEVDESLRRRAIVAVFDRFAARHGCTFKPATETAPASKCTHPDHRRDMRACREAWDLLGLLDDAEPLEDDWQPQPARRPAAPKVYRHDWTWTDRAACQGEDLVLFFGPDGERQPERDIRERKAKTICSWCPVRRDCLDYALTRPERSGLYGGLNEDERAAERRRRMRRGELAVNAS